MKATVESEKGKCWINCCAALYLLNQVQYRFSRKKVGETTVVILEFSGKAWNDMTTKNHKIDSRHAGKIYEVHDSYRDGINFIQYLLRVVGEIGLKELRLKILGDSG